MMANAVRDPANAALTLGLNRSAERCDLRVAQLLTATGKLLAYSEIGDDHDILLLHPQHFVPRVARESMKRALLGGAHVSMNGACLQSWQSRIVVWCVHHAMGEKVLRDCQCGVLVEMEKVLQSSCDLGEFVPVHRAHLDRLFP